MKKFLLALILILSFSFSASGYETVSISLSGESFETVSIEDVVEESADVSGDVVSVVVGKIYTLRPVSFASVHDSLTFASSPNSYIAKFDTTSRDNILEKEESAYKDIIINLDNAELGQAVSLSDYSVNSIIINGRGKTLSTSYAREFILNSSQIDFTLNNLTFNGDGSSAGIQIESIKSAKFSNVTFRNITSSSGVNGGAVTMTGGDNVEFERCRFSSNTSEYGGAVYISGGNGITFNGCAFSSNTAEYGGGAMYIAGGSNYTFSGSNIFSSNTAGTNGGAVAVSSSALPNFSGVIFDGTNNAAHGGSVYVGGGATFSGGTSFSSSSADLGGSLYIASGTVTVSSDVTFSGSKANDGGIVYAAGGNTILKVNLDGDKSTATAKNGGAVYVSGGTVNIEGSMNGNVASNAGGAIYIFGGTVNITTSADISENSSNYGGAVYITGRGSRFAVLAGDYVTFNANSSVYGGGAVYVDSSASSSVLSFTPEVIFSENYVSNGNGGALWLGSCAQLPSGTVTFEGNQARRTDSTDNTNGNGGAVYIGDSTSATITLNSSYDYKFTGNTAYVYGGALFTMSSDVVFDGLIMEDKNTAIVGGGFASSGSGRFTIQNGSVISNQTAPIGGAVYSIGRLTLNDAKFSGNIATEYGGAIYGAGEITVTSADFSGNTCSGSENGQGGGAIYASGTLTITDSMFSNNVAAQEGGAICGNDNDVTIVNSYFDSNKTESGNGGAVMLANASTLTVSRSTFTNNKSGYDGGSFYAQGETLDINFCYFEENQSTKRGGAVYFDQSSGSASNAHFSITDSMLRYNSAAGESGGGLHIATNTATIRRCTFDNNVISGSGYGGGVYLNTTVVGESSSNIIENCTFTSNSIVNGGSGTSGGGGLALECEQTSITFCTFSMNDSAYKGGGIFVAGGKAVLAGVLAVGNTDSGAYDIWVDDSVESGGYNRIGVYGQGSGVTDFVSVTRNETDVTGYPNKNWNKETFFTDASLAVNEKSSSIPPYIGSTIAGQERLLTLMLSEDKTLPVAYRATNAIPYSTRSRFPNIDERGASRILGNRVNLDIGAVFFDGTRDDGGDDDNDAYTISYIRMSGVPNEMRRVGQTTALISKVFYTNGRTAYGGSGEGEENVTWSSDKPSIVRIDPETGVLTALQLSRGGTIVRITVTTVRTDKNGNFASDSKFVKVVEPYEEDMNVSPEVANYVEDFTDYNRSYGISSNIAAVSSAEFQAGFSQTWGDSAIISTTVDASDREKFYATETYTSSEGYKKSHPAAINVNYEVQNVNMISLSFLFEYSGEELKKILGHDASGVNLDPNFAKELFKSIRIEFQATNSSTVVIGEGSNVDVEEALNCGALKLESMDRGKGVKIILTAVIADVEAENGEVQDASVNDRGVQIISGVLVVPDGVNDGSIYGAMWAAEKGSSSPEDSGSKISSGGAESQSQNDSGEGSGGSCNSLGLGIFAGILVVSLKTKRK